MRDILDQLVDWHRAGVSFAVATVLRTFDSAPRRAGAAMAVSQGGTVVGSVSGGCVESAIVEIAGEVLSTGAPTRTVFGVADEDAFAVGLTCGGTIEVSVVRYSHHMGQLLCHTRQAVQAGQPVSLGMVLTATATELVMFDGHTLVGSTGSDGFDRKLRTQMANLLGEGVDALVRVGGPDQACAAQADLDVFVHSFATAPRMIVFGAIDFARALVQVAKLMGYHVTVCDARAVFATRARFPEADAVVVDWPHRYLAHQELDSRAVLCVLTHDAKFDVPLLLHALQLPVAYVGAMGSRRTCAQREQALREAGLPAAALERLHAPIGLDIGGRTPTETALSIVAEIVATREQRSGTPLSRSTLPIHGPDLTPAAGIATDAPPSLPEASSRSADVATSTGR
jgi:xanthine dehydrogenase accessory factor